MPTSREKGRLAEQKASCFLQNLGFEIVDRNFYSRFGEIDLIAFKNKTLHFIEVKSGVRFEPIYAITPKKIEKILKTIDFYLTQHHIAYDYCLSVIVIKGDEIQWLENIML